MNYYFSLRLVHSIQGAARVDLWRLMNYYFSLRLVHSIQGQPGSTSGG